jgi:hypothetical protein
VVSRKLDLVCNRLSEKGKKSMWWNKAIAFPIRKFYIHHGLKVFSQLLSAY